MRTRLFLTKRSILVMSCCLMLVLIYIVYQQLSRAPHKIQACPLPPLHSEHPNMIWVPGGNFTMGDTVYPEEQPLTPRHVEGFWLSRTEVTNAEFAEFVQATHYVTVAERGLDPTIYPELPDYMRQAGGLVFTQPTHITDTQDASQWWQYVPGANWQHPDGPNSNILGQEHYPVTQITLEDALAYATWKGQSIPTETQWEWAARETQSTAQPPTQPIEANTWQGLFPIKDEASDGFQGLAPVACFKPNALGIYDLIGNVWELTQSVYKETIPHADSTINAIELTQKNAPMASIKGGSYLCSPNYCMRYRAGARQGQELNLSTNHIGFRTVLIAPAPKSKY